jgi:TonB-dependent SusC/RagA subfamily outer membrane receptor
MPYHSRILTASLLLFSFAAQAQSPAQPQAQDSVNESATARQHPVRVVCTQLPGSDKPLYIVNGAPMASSFTPEDVPAKYIKEVNVLTGNSAAALYGSRGGTNGVVLITTKRRWKPGKS